jgi:hypothetical protein
MGVTITLTNAEVEDLLFLLKDREELKPLADKLKPSVSNTVTPETPSKAKFQLGATSLTRLKGVHPDLVKVVRRAIEITPIDFTVLEGLRTKERQKQLVAKGASKTMNSRHLTGDAVDIAPLVDGKVTWDWKYYFPVAEAMRQAAKELGVKVKWGANWKYLNDSSHKLGPADMSKSFPDGPHYQLDR